MDEAKSYSYKVRRISLELCHRYRTSHIGSCFSVADILASLYGSVLNLDEKRPFWDGRDRLFFSKGHACAALYAALSVRGFFSPNELLENYTKDGEYFCSHVNHKVPGVELSTGSLGHALGVACGSALAGLRQKKDYRVYAVLSDGELDEGSNWEAIMFAAHNQLSNLTAIIDYNKIQSFGSVAEVMSLEPLADKFRAFNWCVEEVDGHSLSDLTGALSRSLVGSKPRCVIAHTIKGKGVSFMEGELAWHYRSPDNRDYERALVELETLYA